MKPQVLRKPIVSDDLCTMLREFQLKAIEYGSVITNTSNPHGEDFTHLYRLNYVAEGHVFYKCCGKTIHIEDNTLVFLPPQAILEIEENDKQVVLFFVNFEVNNLAARDSFHRFMCETFPSFHVHDKNNLLRSLFNTLIGEGEQNEIGACMAIQGIFYNILVNMIRFSSTYHSPDRNPEIISGSAGYFNHAIQYINQNISQNIKISDIAAEIGISEIYLYKIFMKHAKKSPQQLIQVYRIQLAKNYLRNPGLSIKTISTELGFSNPNHFSTLFKKATGMSPKEYRTSIDQHEPIQLSDES